jgi:hypothetical protein
VKKMKENSGRRFAVSVAIDFGDIKQAWSLQPAGSGQVSARRVSPHLGNNPDACRNGRIVVLAAAALSSVSTIRF